MWTEGDNIAVPPLIRRPLAGRGLKGSRDPCAVSGAPGGAYRRKAGFGPLLRDVFTPVSPPPLTMRGLSGRERAALLVPVIALTGSSIAGNDGFVNGVGGFHRVG